MPGPARPVADALWVGEAGANKTGASDGVAVSYWRTRAACVAHLRARLAAHVAAGRRVLIGCDFPYSYPAGYAVALDLPGAAPPWRRIWDALAARVTDDAANANNRFAVAAALNARCGAPAPGPLWGCPPAAATATLAPTSPVFPYPVRPGLALERWRRVDRRFARIQPAWKLYGVGSAGGQTLVGLPAVRALRDDPALAPWSRVWPFETGFTPAPVPAAGPAILHAEIWPGVVARRLESAFAIHDEAQVRAVVAWLRDLDAAGALGALFAAPAGLGAADLAACIVEEGWLLGA